MASATARFVRMFRVPKASWSFLDPAVSSTAAGSTHSTARAIRQSKQNMQTPINTVERMEANSWGM